MITETAFGHAHDTRIDFASARPAQETIRAGTKQKSSGKGKPQGAISQVWRKVFHNIFQKHQSFGYSDISRAYTLTIGTEVTMSAIRDRVRRFVEQGFMSGSADSGFTFTPLAVEKFGLDKTSPNENGATEVAPEAEGIGVAAPVSSWSNPKPSW